MSTNNCNYHTVSKDGKVSKLLNDICFARIKYENLKEFHYLPKIEGGLSDDAVNFYIEFLKKLLTDLEFEGNIVETERGKSVLFKLLTLDYKNRIHNLLYLTAFRYVDEYSGIVKEFFDSKNSKESFEETFNKFQTIHYSKSKFFNLGGHGLICPKSCYGESGENPITLEQFKQNLQNKKNTVQAYFL
jgi:hypothetical protein